MYIALAILGGLIVLVWGAEWLVRGASRLAFALGVPPLIVGLTVVAFGTSAPELAVTVQAALAGEAGVGLGNVFGSNTMNILLVLGLSAAISRLPVSEQLLRLDVPFLIVVSCATFVMAWDQWFVRSEGVLLVLGLLVYLGIQIYLGKTHEQDFKDLEESEALLEKKPAMLKLGMAVLYCLFGLIMLVVGADYLVDGAVQLATLLGASDEIVGLTVVSIGTSMPEIVTSIVAAAQGKRDMAIGNVIGSNLFNLLAVLGIACTVAPASIEVSPALIRVDIPVMVLAAAICLPIFRSGRVVSRWEGGIMLAGYFVYLAYQILKVVWGASAS